MLRLPFCKRQYLKNKMCCAACVCERVELWRWLIYTSYTRSVKYTIHVALLKCTPLRNELIDSLPALLAEIYQYSFPCSCLGCWQRHAPSSFVTPRSNDTHVAVIRTERLLATNAVGCCSFHRHSLISHICFQFFFFFLVYIICLQTCLTC